MTELERLYRLENGKSLDKRLIEGLCVHSIMCSSMTIWARRYHVRRMIRATIGQSHGVMRFEVWETIRFLKGRMIITAFAFHLRIQAVLASPLPTESPRSSRWTASTRDLRRSNPFRSGSAPRSQRRDKTDAAYCAGQRLFRAPPFSIGKLVLKCLLEGVTSNEHHSRGHL